MTRRLVWALVAVSATAAAQDLRLAAPFADHAVVQRDAPLPVWGTAAPGTDVTVELADAAASGTADAEGAWRVELPALPLGGPYTLTARAGAATVTSEDVHVGDVYLCTGQSNMAIPVSRSLNAAAEMRVATDSTLRMMTIPTVADPTPQQWLPDEASWEVASPETVASWSAVCTYFARDLRPTYEGPIGLIVSAWGGSNIRAWLDEAAVRAVGGHDDALEALQLYTQDEPAAQQVFGETWETWWRARSGDAPGTEPWQPDAGADWAAAPAGLGDWTQWDDLRGYTGMVWFRTTVSLTAEQAAQGATLHIGAVDEVDETWLNGEVVGNTFGYGTERTYPIPAGTLREGENVLVTNVLNTWATGGLIGDDGVRALMLADGTRIPLGDWRYEPAPRGDQPPGAPWQSVTGLTTIHNAMVAPLDGLGLRGVLWYQGESNTTEGATYRAELAALVDQWRRMFGDDLPAFVVQLAGFGSLPTAPPGESGSAEVREGQRLVAHHDPRVGLATAVDVGDVADIHPLDKQAVGRRLAQSARALVYGEPVEPSGPGPLRADHQGDEVVVHVGGVTDHLVVYGDARPIGFELCGVEAGTCRYVVARLDGASIVLSGALASDVRVRHAWADHPIVTVFDGSDRPLVPFDVPIGP